MEEDYYDREIKSLEKSSPTDITDFLSNIKLKFKSKREKDISLHKERGDKAIKMIENKNHKILELGTGQGEMYQSLKEKGFNVTGTDIKKYPETEDLNIVLCDLNNRFPFRDSSFDVVIALELLEHMFNPYKTMEEIKRVLKPNGYAIISMPNTASLFSRIGQLYEPRFENLEVYFHHHQPCIKSIRNLIKTQLKIEEEVYLLGFKKLFFLNYFSKFFLKINRNLFCGDFMIKARNKK